MRLTREDNRDAIRRYGHIKPARATGRVCATGCPGTSRSCTLARGHRGPHVSHGAFRRVMAVWDGGQASRAPERARARTPGARARRARSMSPEPGRLGRIWKRVVRFFGSVEQLTMLVLLVAFVVFGIQWLLIIFR